MKRHRVTGIGGVFFRSKNPSATSEWYRTHLGIADRAFEGEGEAQIFEWRDHRDAEKSAYTVWTPMPDETDYFSPGEASFMVCYRVDDLDAMLKQLSEDGVEQVGEPQDWFNGRFAWVMDPEGRKIELWEPATGH